MDKKECLEKIEEEVEETSVTPCVEELEDEVKRLKEELAKSQEEYLRKVADLDNYRKRLVREKESAVQFANENLLNDLIPILDDLDRAIVAGEEGDDV